MSTTTPLVFALDSWDFERYSPRNKAAHRRRRRNNIEKKWRRLDADDHYHEVSSRL